MTPAKSSPDTESAGDERGTERRGVAGVRGVVAEARSQFSELTGRPTESVISVERIDEGWRLNVEVVELERIPASTSILGVYEVTVDRDGNLLEYARTGRYHRNQAGDDE